jgi:2-methylcitrate dehydratase PrpD
MFEKGVEILFKVPYRGYTFEGDHLGAGARAAAGRMLAADPERLRSALSLSG